MKEMIIYALEPPGNIQKPFYTLQNILFQKKGLISARLLPPVIPLCVSGDNTREREIHSIVIEALKNCGSLETENTLAVSEKSVTVPLKEPGISAIAEARNDFLTAAVQDSRSGAGCSAGTYAAPGILLAFSSGNDPFLTGTLSEMETAGQRWQKTDFVVIRYRYPDEHYCGETGEWEFITRIKITLAGG